MPVPQSTESGDDEAEHCVAKKARTHPYFPHYRAHWIIRRTVNEWSIFELFHI